jgi:hypothetical protein
LFQFYKYNKKNVKSPIFRERIKMQGKGGRGGGGGGGRGRKRNKNRKRDRRLGEIKYDAEGKMIDDRNTEAGKLLGYKVGNWE